MLTHFLRTRPVSSWMNTVYTFGGRSKVTDAAGRFSGILTGLDSRGAGFYHQRRRQGGLDMALSRVDMGNPRQYTNEEAHMVAKEFLSVSEQ